MSVRLVVFLPYQFEADAAKIREICIKRRFHNDQRIIRDIFLC